MNRLFSFGCSFTRYWRWPTWANILGHSFDRFENWGICGGGNPVIFYSLIEAHERNCIGSNDTVIVMWTNTSREDHYVRDRWLEGGNVYWSDDENAKQFACERGYLIRDLAMISAAHQLLKSWGCRWRFVSMVPLANSNNYNQMGWWHTDANLEDVLELYNDTLNIIGPSVYETVFGLDWTSRPGIVDANTGHRDFHPSPVEHLLYLDQVFPEYSINQNTRQWIIDITDRLQQGQHIDWQEPNIPQRF